MAKKDKAVAESIVCVLFFGEARCDIDFKVQATFVTTLNGLLAVL